MSKCKHVRHVCWMMSETCKICETCLSQNCLRHHVGSVGGMMSQTCLVVVKIKKERTRHETLHVVQLSETWSQTLMVVRQCLTGACVLDKKRNVFETGG
jgi:hypothetical protein